MQVDLLTSQLFSDDQLFSDEARFRFLPTCFPGTDVVVICFVVCFKTFSIRWDGSLNFVQTRDLICRGTGTRYTTAVCNACWVVQWYGTLYPCFSRCRSGRLQSSPSSRPSRLKRCRYVCQCGTSLNQCVCWTMIRDTSCVRACQQTAWHFFITYLVTAETTRASIITSNSHGWDNAAETKHASITSNKSRDNACQLLLCILRWFDVVPESLYAKDRRCPNVVPTLSQKVCAPKKSWK